MEREISVNLIEFARKDETNSEREKRGEEEVTGNKRKRKMKIRVDP